MTDYSEALRSHLLASHRAGVGETSEADRQVSRLRRATGIQIDGVPLEPSHEQRLGGEQWSVLVGCLCAAEPCTCEGLTLWVSESSVLQSKGTGRRSIARNEVRRYTLKRDATVVLEALLPVKAQGMAALRTLKRGGHPLASPTREAPDPALRSKPTGGSLAEAFVGGVAGRWLDQELGLSDALFDLLVDVLD